MRQATLMMILLALAAAPCAANFTDDYARGNFVSAEALLQPGAVRAEVVRDTGQLLGGPKREGRVGDFKLHNSRVGFIIAGTRPATGIYTYGGVLEEAGILKPEAGGARWFSLLGDTCPALYKGADPLLGLRMLAPVSAEILEDGSGGEAIVRITSRDAEWPERKEVTTMDSRPHKVQAVTDYILRADTNVLEIRYTFINVGKKGQALAVANMYLSGDGSNLFAPGSGFDIDAAENMEFPIFTAVGGGVSYGWFPETGSMTVNAAINRRLITTFGKIKLPAGGEQEFRMYLAVGHGGSSSVAEAMNALRGETGTGAVRGTVLESNTGAPAADAVVHALSPNGAMAANTNVNADGSFRLVLAPGEYMLQAAAYDRAEPEPVRISVAPGQTADAQITVSRPARLDYEITDAQGSPIPAVISFKLSANRTGVQLDPWFYFNKTTDYGGGFFKTHFALPEPGGVAIRPGTYDVYVSRGLEYEYQKKTITLEPGQAVKETFSLAHSVDTTGYLCGDFHIHAQPSNDANDLLFDKVRSIAAVGLEAPVATDHDVNTDYTPFIEELGLGQYMKSIVGDELTTIRLGHFNAYPLTFDPAKKNWGAPVWFGMSPQDIMQAFRDDPSGNTIVQINHPRDGSMGYFDVIGYNPETGTAQSPDLFSLNFDGMEVLNGTSYDKLEQTVPDWFSFLDRGKRVIGLGNSDNHSTFSLGVGYPRNCVASPTDAPGDMVEDQFIAAVRAQQVTVDGGAFITVTANGTTGPGGTAAAHNGAVTLRITVQAPAWMSLTTMTVIAGGQIIDTRDISAADGIVRFDGAITHTPARDTWYVITVDGDQPLFPVYPAARPYSFTNPIYVDTDGNGAYDPPLAFSGK